MACLSLGLHSKGKLYWTIAQTNSAKTKDEGGSPTRDRNATLWITKPDD